MLAIYCVLTKLSSHKKKLDGCQNDGQIQLRVNLAPEPVRTQIVEPIKMFQLSNAGWNANLAMSPREHLLSLA